jgi:hypothetical protein
MPVELYNCKRMATFKTYNGLKTNCYRTPAMRLAQTLAGI